MWGLVWVSAFVGGLWLGLVQWHHASHGVVQPLHASLSLFLCVNLLICLWEIVLFFHIDAVQAGFAGKKKRLERGDLGPVLLFEPMSLGAALTPRTWAEVWAVYSLADESYSQTGSFGWSIDVGNGFSTLVPTVLFALGMTLHEALLPPRVLGIVGALSFYQELYGTLVYFLQYCVNRRWDAHGNSAAQVFVLVIMSNIVWIAVPAVGLWASCQLILSDSASPYLDLFVR